MPPVDRCLEDNGGCAPEAICKDLHYHGNTSAMTSFFFFFIAITITHLLFESLTCQTHLLPTVMVQHSVTIVTYLPAEICNKLCETYLPCNVDFLC